MKAVSRLFLALLLLSSGRGSASAQQKENFYRVHVRNSEDYTRAYTLGHTVVLSKAGEYVDIVAPPVVARKLTALGLRVELVQEDLVGTFDQIRFKSDRGAYHTHEELAQELTRLARENPDRVVLKSIGPTWETSVGQAKRQIWAVRVAGKSCNEPDRRPQVLIFGGIHSREVATTEVLLDFVRYLLEKDGTDPRVTHVMANRQVWVLPELNPDGREYVFNRDMWWRKNRRRIDASGAVGVDLNRNFGYRWGDLTDSKGSSSDPFSGTYRGETAFSEPETRAFRDFVLSRSFLVSLAYHSYGEYLLYPYGFTSKPTPDAPVFEALGRELGRILGYRSGDVLSMVGYPSNGRHDDWLYSSMDGKRRTLAMEIELGRTFFPPEAELPALFTRTREANLTMALLAGGYPEVRILSTGTPRQIGPGPEPRRKGSGYSIYVHNRGLVPITNLRIFAMLGGQEMEVTSAPILRLRGILPGNGPRQAWIPLPSRIAGSNLTDARLRLKYEDLQPASLHVPLALPAD